MSLFAATGDSAAVILRQLLDKVPGVRVVEGTEETEITRLAYDSRHVKEGDLFFALSGTESDGHLFLEEAVHKGARAVAVQRRLAGPLGVTVLCTENTRRVMADMASLLYGEPSRRLSLVGITGTNGKTTVTYLLEAIWRAAGFPAGVIGTINYRYGKHVLSAPYTTPPSPELQRLLAHMAAAHVSHVAVEVSSHALALERVRGCHWDGGVFTNIGRDHLDFHRDLEEYFQAKARLFREELAASAKEEKFAVINTDDPWGKRLLGQLPARALTYGREHQCTVSLLERDKDLRGIRGALRVAGKRFSFDSSLIGDPHVYNIMAAVAVAHAQKIPPDAMREGIRQCRVIPGRLESIDMGQDFSVVVDYAHTPDALEGVLRSLRDLVAGRIITVFGCGGDRDRGKRPLMGEMVARLSHVAILTSDNPRSEDPVRIIREVERGVRETGLERLEDGESLKSATTGYLILEDRRTAIAAALKGARSGDLVFIAGKGHEAYQIVGRENIPLDDRAEVRALLRSPGEERG